jgi:hypothetical protein
VDVGEGTDRVRAAASRSSGPCASWSVAIAVEMATVVSVRCSSMSSTRMACLFGKCW